MIDWTDEDVDAALGGRYPHGVGKERYRQDMRAALDAALASAQAREAASVPELERDAAQWKAHENVMRAALQPDSLRIVLQVRRNDLLCEREVVLDARELDGNFFGVRMLSMLVERYYAELKSAMQEQPK